MTCLAVYGSSGCDGFAVTPTTPRPRSGTALPGVAENVAAAVGLSANVVAGVNLVAQGLANVGGLKTYRHGTNPVSALGIHLTGADPKLGGASFGSSYLAEHQKESAGCFHVFDDPYRWPNSDPESPPWWDTLVARLGPRQHAAISGFRAALPSPDESPKRPKDFTRGEVIRGAVGALFGVMTPTVKVFQKDHGSIAFEPDPDYKGGMDRSMALRTREHIPAHHVGPLGAWQAFCPDQIRSRVQRLSHPQGSDPIVQRKQALQVLEGCIQLALSAQSLGPLVAPPAQKTAEVGVQTAATTGMKALAVVARGLFKLLVGVYANYLS